MPTVAEVVRGKLVSISSVSGPRYPRLTRRSSAQLPRIAQESRGNLRENALLCAEFVQHALPKYPDFARANTELLVSWDRAPDHLDAFGSPVHRHVFRDAIATRGSSSVPMPGRRSSSRLPRGWRSCLANANWLTGTVPGRPP